VEGVVVEGDHRGRELGYPTANVSTSGMVAVPADGVYAGTLQRLDDPGAPVWPAAISVGTNPTFEGVERRVESYVLDRDDLELYDVPVRVAFRERLRGQVRFDDIDALVRQMADDVDRSRAALADLTG
jgi:riboflavin kinase/FMN adenylyltransferase